MSEWDDLKKKYDGKLSGPASQSHDHKKIIMAVAVILAVGAVYFVIFSVGDMLGVSLPDGSQQALDGQSQAVSQAPQEVPVESAGPGPVQTQPPVAAADDTQPPAQNQSTPAQTAETCDSTLTISNVTDDKITFHTNGTDGITGVSVRDFTGPEISSLSSLQSGSSATVAFSRGNIGGIVVSGTCDGHPISTTCISSNSCWTPAAAQQNAQADCSTACINGWRYLPPTNTCIVDSCISGCEGLDNQTTFETESKCQNTAVIFDECMGMLNITGATAGTVTLRNWAQKQFTEINLMSVYHNETEVHIASISQMSPGQTNNVQWPRTDEAGFVLFGVCNGESYADVCMSDDPTCWN